MSTSEQKSGESFSRQEPIVLSGEQTYAASDFLIPTHYRAYIDSVLIPHGLVRDRVEKLAHDIRSHYNGKTIHLVCVLKGGSTFFHHLLSVLEQLHKYSGADYVPFTFDFVRVKSYEGTESTGNVQITGVDLNTFKGKEILLVEDIIDTGNTMQNLLPMLEKYGPASVKVTSLLEKRTEKSCGYKADFVGFSVPDKFVIGYCLDYNEIFRDLEHICIINNAGIAKWADHE